MTAEEFYQGHAQKQPLEVEAFTVTEGKLSSRPSESEYALYWLAQEGIRGALLDVIVDLRPYSPMYRKWDAVELTADNRRMLYMPEGIAHGYLTLTDDVEAYYHASARWAPQAESGVRWNDPAFGIEWPFPPTVISEKDGTWPLLR